MRRRPHRAKARVRSKATRENSSEEESECEAQHVQDHVEDVGVGSLCRAAASAGDALQKCGPVVGLTDVELDMAIADMQAKGMSAYDPENMSYFTELACARGFRQAFKR